MRSVNQVADALPPHPPVFTVPRPVDDERLAAHVVERDEAPEATVVAAIAVVAHDEDLIVGHLHRAEIVARCEPAVVAGALDELAPRVIELRAVDEDLLVLHLDGVPGLADHA